MKLITLLLTLSTLFATELSTTHSPKVDIEATDYIALYECKNGKLKLLWHSEYLEEEELKELKKEEGKPCKK